MNRILALAFCLMAPATVFAEGVISIGVIIPLTGPLAEYGVAAKNGIELAKQQHPENFASVRFVYEDSRYDSMTAVTIFEKMRTDPNLKLAYVWGFGPNQAVAPIAESRKFPIFAVSGERSISRDRKYVIRFGYFNEQIAQVQRQYLREHGMKRIALIKTELAYNNSVYDALKENLAPDESIELIDNYEMGQIDFRPSLLKLRGKHFDVVGAFLVGNQISQFYRQVAELKLKLTTFGTDFFEGAEEVRRAGPAIIGAVYAGHYVDPEFSKQYVERYGINAQLSWAANAYEFAMLAGRVLGTPPQTADESGPILGRFRGLGRQLGVLGPYEFGESDHGPAFDFSVVAKRVTADGVENVPVIPTGQSVKPEPIERPGDAPK